MHLCGVVAETGMRWAAGCLAAVVEDGADTDFGERHWRQSRCLVQAVSDRPLQA